MEFKCDSIPVNQLLVGTAGINPPICNRCIQTECTNPIRMHPISIMGVKHNWRLWTMNRSLRQVVRCDGYIDEITESINTDDEKFL